jgi:hypothetical protein
VPTDTGQLDAGMHPAHEGLSAMPFYDDFDLSTVDVLLISQYVFARHDFHFSTVAGGIRRITAVGLGPSRRLVYQNQWNIICTLLFRLQ